MNHDETITTATEVHVGDRIAFKGFRTTLWGEVVKITPRYYHVRWTAARSGKVRVRPIGKHEAILRRAP